MEYPFLQDRYELFRQTLDKPRLVVANKIDEAAAVENLKRFKRRVPQTPALSIAAAFDQGIGKFRDTIRKAVEKTRAG